MSLKKMNADKVGKIPQDELKKFGIEGIDTGKIFKAALRHGGALAELFFEETFSTRIIFEGGKVDKILNGTDRGVGFRIIFDKKSVYGYTTDLTESSLLKLAETLSEAVQTKDPKKTSLDIEWGEARQSDAEIANYKIQKDPRDIGIAPKIELARRAEG